MFSFPAILLKNSKEFLVITNFCCYFSYSWEFLLIHKNFFQANMTSNVCEQLMFQFCSVDVHTLYRIAFHVSKKNYPV